MDAATAEVCWVRFSAYRGLIFGERLFKFGNGLSFLKGAYIPEIYFLLFGTFPSATLVFLVQACLGEGPLLFFESVAWPLDRYPFSRPPGGGYNAVDFGVSHVASFNFSGFSCFCWWLNTRRGAHNNSMISTKNNEQTDVADLWHLFRCSTDDIDSGGNAQIESASLLAESLHWSELHHCGSFDGSKVSSTATRCKGMGSQHPRPPAPEKSSPVELVACFQPACLIPSRRR